MLNYGAGLSLAVSSYTVLIIFGSTLRMSGFAVSGQSDRINWVNSIKIIGEIIAWVAVNTRRRGHLSVSPF